MRYFALACDYDDTLASSGSVTDETIAAMELLLASGRKMILVTGRELQDLLATFARADLFEWVVAENGCVLYQPANRVPKRLADPPPAKLIAALQRRKVEPLALGQVIVATRSPHEHDVVEVIRELDLEFHVAFNKGAVMILPSGVNKATGLLAALQEMKLSPHNVAGVGDAENDHAFLRLCQCSVAVASALPALKEIVDFVTCGGAGAGARELIREIIATDLREREPLLVRHHLCLGSDAGDCPVRVDPYDLQMLLAGPSGAGKSTALRAIIERLLDQCYQFCVIDPEGNYDAIEGTVALGSRERPPTIDEALKLLKNPDENVVVNLVGLALDERPAYFLGLLSRLEQLRAQCGRPHMILADEAHHFWPASWQPSAVTFPQAPDGVIYITAEPTSLNRAVLASINCAMVLGDTPKRTLRAIAAALGKPAPTRATAKLKPGEALLWLTGKESLTPCLLKTPPSRSERRRHRRK